MFFSNYDNIVEFFDGPYAIIYKGFRASDEKPVVIKLLKKESSLDELASLQASAMDQEPAPEILKPLEYLFVNQRLGFVYPDLGMLFLRVLVQDQQLELTQFLNLAVSLARHLERLHQAGVVHQDLTPGNILISDDFTEVRFIGFFSMEKRGSKTPFKTRQDEPFFAYTPPELLGRTGLEADNRADLYSLGVIFFEALSGQLPFGGTDPMRQVHGHVALKPQSLLELRPLLPAPLVKVVEKLLEKSPSRRYRSAKNLMRDLLRIQREVETGVLVTDFEPDSLTQQGSFVLPSRFYGTADALDQLVQVFER